MRASPVLLLLIVPLLAACGAVTGLFSADPDPTDLSEIGSANYLETQVIDRSPPDQSAFTLPDAVARVIAYNLAGQQQKLLAAVDSPQPRQVQPSDLDQLRRQAAFWTAQSWDTVARQAEPQGARSPAIRPPPPGVAAAQADSAAMVLGLLSATYLTSRPDRAEEAFRGEAIGVLQGQAEALYWRVLAGPSLSDRLDDTEAVIKLELDRQQRGPAPRDPAIEAARIERERFLLQQLFQIGVIRQRIDAFRSALIGLMGTAVSDDIGFSGPGIDALQPPSLDLTRAQLISLAEQARPNLLTRDQSAVDALTAPADATSLEAAAAALLSAQPIPPEGSVRASLPTTLALRVDAAVLAFGRAAEAVRAARFRYDLALNQLGGWPAPTMVVDQRPPPSDDEIAGKIAVLIAEYQTFEAFGDLAQSYADLKVASGLQPVPPDYPVDDLVSMRQQVAINQRDGAASVAALARSLGRDLRVPDGTPPPQPDVPPLTVDLGTYSDIAPARQRWVILQRRYPEQLGDVRPVLQTLTGDGVQLLAPVAPDSGVCQVLVAAGDYCLPVPPEAPPPPLVIDSPPQPETLYIGPDSDSASVTVPPAPPPAPTPAPVAADAPVTSGGLVQLAALRSQAEAEAAWASIQSRFPTLMGGRAPRYQRVDLGDRGVFVRVQVAVDNPAAVCAQLEAGGQDCFTVSGSAPPAAAAPTPAPAPAPAPAPTASDRPTALTPPPADGDGAAIRGPDGEILIVDDDDPCAAFIARGIACDIRPGG